MGNFPQERRKFVRLGVHHLVKYRVLDEKESKDTLCFIRNISAGGVLFHSDVTVTPGKFIELQINFPSYPKPVKAVGKILRAIPLKLVGGFDVAVEFINVDDEAKDFINRRILNVFEKTKGGKSMRIVAITCFLLAILSVALAFAMKLNLGIPALISSFVLMRLAHTFLLFSIAASLLKK
ncbi:MAG: PilZ domain-containing protein [Candidatus Omnitrophota bacterium]